MGKQAHPILAILTLGVVLATPADAQQAISKSLATCSAIFEELAFVGETRGKPQDDVNAAKLSAAMFIDAAFAEAKREGHADPYDRVQTDLRTAQADWEGRFGKITLLKDNKDWIDYCRALGKDRGVTLP